jgi:ParB family chromosome partitioning protein
MTTTTITPQALTTIPLDRLIPGKANARRSGQKDGIAQLAASIEAHGLRQNLNAVAVAGSDRFEVVAGGRRLKALKLLVKQKKLAKDAPIPCRVLDEAENAGEISLAENTQRLAMHPLDEFEAFDRLAAEERMPLEDIAARFGVTPLYVERRLKLARVSPTLRALYRKETLSLETLMAFTLTDDHAEQERVWHELPDWSRTAQGIKQALTRETIGSGHRLALFVGLDAYTAAGGGVIRDLFDTEDGGHLTDRPLLVRLAAEKLDAEAERLRIEEGWGWTRAELEYDYATRYGWIEPLPGDDEDDDSERFAPDDMARAGAILRISHDGTLDVTRGLTLPEPGEEGEEDDAPPVCGTAANGKPKADPDALPAALVADVTAHRTAALRLELAGNPDFALAATVHALALDLLYPHHFGTESCLALRGSSEGLERHITCGTDSPAHAALAEKEAEWRTLLPEKPSDLFAFCLSLGQTVLLDLLAYLAALSVNAVQQKPTHTAYGNQSARLAHADALAQAIALDMTRHWTPSVEGFYVRLSKAQLVQAVTEAKAPMQVSINSLRKADAARYVEKAMAGTGWLPAPLRNAAG